MRFVGTNCHLLLTTAVVCPLATEGVIDFRQPSTKLFGYLKDLWAVLRATGDLDLSGSAQKQCLLTSTEQPIGLSADVRNKSQRHSKTGLSLNTTKR